MSESVDGVDRRLSRYNSIHLAAHIQRHAPIERISEVKANPRALPGDTRRLRGIPAIGLGVTGAIPGTIPHAIVHA